MYLSMVRWVYPLLILYMHNIILTIPYTHSTSFPCPQSFFKVCECVAYLVHSDHFITVDNFSMCVHCVWHFIEIAASKQALDHDLDQELELFPSFAPPTLSKATPTVTEGSHSEERVSKERRNDSLSSAITSLPVAIPAAFSRGECQSSLCSECWIPLMITTAEQYHR